MKFIIFTVLLFVAGAYAGISTIDRHVEDNDNQLMLRGFPIPGPLEKIIELKNLIPAIFDTAKFISQQLQMGVKEAICLIIDTITSLLGIVPILIKQVPEFAKNLPAIVKALPPVIDTFKILIDASPDLMKALPPVVAALPDLAEKLVPTLQATPDIITTVPAVIDILPDLSNILRKLAPVLNNLNKSVDILAKGIVAKKNP